MKFDETFNEHFVKLHDKDKNSIKCFEKVEEEFCEFSDAHEIYDKLRRGYYNLDGDTTLEDLEKSELEMTMELMDVIQASVTMLGYLEKKNIFNEDVVEMWKKKQSEREVKYNVK